ncbi:MAG: carbon storage regulator CsrA [Chloroflexi bacterium]|nr:carbon storage regulator CsrA [Chloroflexota bacterium]
MLVLTRRIDEILNIGENITVTVLAIEGDKVKLGIKAPREIPILRNEIYQAVAAQEMLAKSLASGLEPDSFQDLRDLLAAEVDK